jgi:hypothetical protein
VPGVARSRTAKPSSAEQARTPVSLTGGGRRACGSLRRFALNRYRPGDGRRFPLIVAIGVCTPPATELADAPLGTGTAARDSAQSVPKRVGTSSRREAA